MNPNDPDVIALSKAIFQRESGGNFNAVGDAGTSHGAGQWQPGTWKAQAKDVLGDPNAKMTPDNQKAVIQVTIAKRKAAGLNPAQIAAEWNSGKTHGWENHVGTTTINGQAIHYDTPKYVKDVTELYHQYKGSVPGYGAPTANAQVPGYESFGQQTQQPQNTNVSQAGGSPVDSGFGAAVQHRIGQVSDAAQTGVQGLGELAHGHVGRGAFDVGSGVLQGAGAVAGGVGDAIGGVLGLIPGVKQVEGLIGKGVGALAKTKPGQAAVQAGESFAAKHPVLSKDIGAATNIGGLALGGIGGKVAKDAIGEGVSQGAREGLLGATIKGAAEKRALAPIIEAISPEIRSGTVKGAKDVAANGVTKTGFLGKVSRIQDPQIAEQASVIADNLPKAGKLKTASELYNAVEDTAIPQEAEALRAELRAPDVQNIVNPDLYKQFKGQIEESIKNDANLIGDSGEYARRFLLEFEKHLPNGANATAEDVLNARQALDRAAKAARPQVFDAARINAYSEGLSAVRNAANKLIGELAPQANVQASLRRQALLYRASKVLATKADKEVGTSRFGRFVGRHPKKAGLIKLVGKAALTGVGIRGAEELF